MITSKLDNNLSKKLMSANRHSENKYITKTKS